MESFCIDNLSALLREPSVDVNSKGPMFKTPLNFLAEKISDENFHQIFSCIQLLIQHGADVNVPDKREVTPITYILKNRNLSKENKETIVKYFFQHAVEVDVDTYRNGEARKLLIEQMPNIGLMQNGSSYGSRRSKRARQWDFNHLYLSLKNEKVDEFLGGLEQIAEKNPDTLQELFTASENRETLLIAAVCKDLSQAVERMVHFGADVNYYVSTTVDTLSPVKCACIRGHWRSLEILLRSPELDVNSAPLLPTVVRNLGQKATHTVNFEKCFQILLNHQNIDINQLDVTHSSALHYAVKCNNSYAALQLLAKGAYIGVRNRFNHLAISNINPKVLEKHFDTCITANGCRRSDDDFEVHIDYKNLVNANVENVSDEMAAIEYISKSNELKRLMMHPIIASFLSLKWNRLALFFYINFFICVLFAVITVIYILAYYDSHEESSMKNALGIAMFLLTIYIAVREMSQFTFSPRVYLTSLENYLECGLVVLVMLILFDVCSESLRRSFAATSILLIAIEIFLLAGSLPFWSFCTHFVMLKTVTWSFLKSLMLYAIIWIAFSLSFYTLLHDSSKKEQTNDNANADNDDESDFNSFSNLGLTIMKTLVMSTGEFDVASINFKANAFSYFIFLMFVFLVTIILLNLLNGLAVNDTQVIKSEAELTNFIRRSQVLARYEGVLASRYIFLSTFFNWIKFLKVNRPKVIFFFFSILPFSCPAFFKIFPFCLKAEIFEEPKLIHEIIIKTNDNNQILIPELISNEDETDTDESLLPLRCSGCFSCSGRCARMDSKIVKLAFQVLDKNALEEHDEHEREQFEKRITKMESTLDTIASKLNELLKK